MSLPLRRSIKLGSILKRPISLRVQPSILPSSLPCSSSSSSRLSTPRHFSTSSSLLNTTSSSSSDLASTSSDSPSSNISSPISFLPSPSQVYAVPFHKNRTQALDKLSIGVRAHSALLSKSVLKGIAFAFSASYPRLFPGLQVELINMAAVYVPVWAVRANIEGKTSEGEEVAVISKGAWFPGTSVAPLSQLHLQPTLHSLPLTLSKYNPKIDLNQHDMDITPVPFDTSPLVLPSLLPSSTLDLGDLGEVESSTVRWNKLDAVPIYLPFYVARFKIGTGEDRQDYSLLYDASSPELNDCVMHFPSVPPLYTSVRFASRVSSFLLLTPLSVPLLSHPDKRRSAL
ncbi:hypothetical protein BDY24DRAFT_397485 [Mrakia frigida]|uniref:uncharacterized protein n=1 Tax=Mrakia frigida TaxID=29902 RepID=UPI003FCBF82F